MAFDFQYFATYNMATQISLIKDSVIDYFTYIARKFTRTFRVNQHKHDKIWDAVFPNKKWLSVASEMGLIPALLGQGVRNLHNGSHRPAYIVLVTSDYSRELREQRKFLLECLKISKGGSTERLKKSCWKNSTSL